MTDGEVRKKEWCESNKKKFWCGVNEMSERKIKTSKERNAESRDREQVSLSYFASGAKAIFSAGSLFGVRPH